MQSLSPPSPTIVNADHVRQWLNQLCQEYFLDDPCDRTLRRLSVAIAAQLDGNPTLRSPIETAIANQSSRNLTDLLRQVNQNAWLGWDDTLIEDLDQAIAAESRSNPEFSGQLIHAIATLTAPAPLPTLTPSPAPPAPDQNLTASQEIAVDGIVQFIRTGRVGDTSTPCAILQGPAGTGKTYALVTAVMQALDAGLVPRDRVLVAAPTHKAKQVIERGFRDRGLSIEAVTTAAMLGLKEEINDKTGEVDFVPDPYADPMLGNYEVIIVDECSMIGPRQLDYIQHSLSPLFHRIIFAGDRAQLPYIEKIDPNHPNLTESPTFHFPGWDLTEIVRYSGAISYLAEDLRLNLDRMPMPNILQWITDDTLSCGDWRDRAIAAFRSDTYRTDPDTYRILAWRNKTVDAYNAMVHTACHGPDAPDYCPGEAIVARKPCTLPVPGSDSPVTILTNGEEVVINDVEPDTHPTLQLPCWKLHTPKGWLYPLQAIAIPEFRRQLDVLRNNAIKAEPHQRSKAWKSFYKYLRANHDVSLAYALTIHKSQGSTFQHTFIDLADIACHGGSGDRAIVRNKLLYTAVTRAAQSIAFS